MSNRQSSATDRALARYVVHGNITRASAEAGISPSTLSRAIKRLAVQAPLCATCGHPLK